MNFRRSGTDLGDLNRKSVSSGQRTRRTTVVDERPDEVLPSGSEQAHASLTLGDLPTRRRRTTYDVKLSDLSPERYKPPSWKKWDKLMIRQRLQKNSIVEKRKVYRVADLTEEEKQERLERKRQQRRESDRRCREKKRAELLRIRQLEAANSSLNGSDVGNSMIALNQKNQTTSGNVTLSDNFSPASVGRKNRSANSSLSGKGRRNSLAGLSEAEKEDRRKMQRREARRRYEERIKAGKLREENEKTPINDPTPRPVGPRRAAPMSLQEKKKQHRNEKAQLSRQEAKKNRDRELAKKRDYMRNYRESKKAEKETEKNDEPEKSLDDSESRTCTDDSDFDDDSFSESEEIFAQVQGRPQNLKSLSLVELRHSRAVGNEVDVMTDLKLWIMDLPPELDQFWNPLFTLCNEMNRGNCWELRKKFLQLHWGTDAKVHNTSLKPRWKSYFYHMWDTILREDYRTPPTCMICQRYECLKVGQLLWCPQYPQFFAVHEFCLQSIPELHEDRVSTGLASFSFESYSIVNLAKAVRRRGFINKCAKADCFKPNAMIGCAEKKCVRSYHLPCLFESQGFYDFLHLTCVDSAAYIYFACEKI
ncbi:unnamed protein product [Caenorhabditis auriculariae]|uniref:PHD-type domain-containing protein n=1 Tax=Caenorhabditis auriculariae TaxID=2777116 RepID=A0A8S1HS31_9PELO|nr:unnamed protein product [Caenorhabditis auriculariae]